MKKFYLSYRLYIFPAIAALCSLFLLIVIIYPQVVKLLNNEKLVSDLNRRGNFLEAKAEAMENYNPLDLDSKVKSVLNAYPADKDFASAVAILQNLTAQAGFNILSLSLGSAGKDPGTPSYGIKLDLLGPQRFLPVLINNIEHSPRLMRVSSLETSTGKDINSITVIINVDVLYAPAPQGFGSIDTPLPQLTSKEEEILATLESSASLLPNLESTASATARGKPNPFE